MQEIRQWLQEAGGSLDDKVARVRSAFHKWYNEGLSWERMAWVLDVFEGHVMVGFGQKVFRVDYTIDAEENVSFASTPWPVYALRYVPAEETEATEAAAVEPGDSDSGTEAVHEAVKLTVHLAEAAKDDAGLFPGSTIVVEGLSANHNEYTRAALESGVEIFEGAKLVADHELEEGEAARPEGSIHDVIGKVTNVRLGERDGRSVLLGDVFISESETKIRTKVKEGILGDLSIRAWGVGTRAENGRFVVESFQPHPYTNIAMVTVGAAGGRLVSESQRTPDDGGQVERDVEESTVTNVTDGLPEPVTEAPRREVRALRESDQAELTEVVAERDQLLQENTRLFRELRETQAERQIAEAVSGAGDLPQATLARIAERTGALKDAFATHGSQQTVEQFREAVDKLVEAERAYLAQIVPNGAVTGLTQPGGGEPVEEILAEAFEGIVPPEQVAVAIRGRG